MVSMGWLFGGLALALMTGLVTISVLGILTWWRAVATVLVDLATLPWRLWRHHS